MLQCDPVCCSVLQGAPKRKKGTELTVQNIYYLPVDPPRRGLDLVARFLAKEVCVRVVGGSVCSVFVCVCVCVCVYVCVWALILLLGFWRRRWACVCVGGGSVCSVCL